MYYKGTQGMREPEEEESRGVHVSEGEGGWVPRRKAGCSSGWSL